MTTRFETYAHHQEDESRMPVGLTAVILALPLTLLASLFWAGMALVGIGMLILAAGLITMSLISVRHYHTPAWGMVIMGQLIGVAGTAVLVAASIL